MKFILQIIAGTLFYFAFGWLVFDFLLGEYTDKNTTQLVGFKKSAEEFSFTFLLLSCIAYACLITYVVSYLVKVKSLKQGFVISAVIGILVAMMTDFYWYSASHFYNNLTVVFLDIISAGLTVGMLGVVVSLFLVFPAKISKH